MAKTTVTGEVPKEDISDVCDDEKLDITKMSIRERMLYIMNEIRIEKNGKNTFSNYDYFKPEEINRKVNPLFLKYKIFPHFTTYIKGYETETTEKFVDGALGTKTQREYKEIAKLTLTDILNPAEELIYEMVLRDIEIKGANKMQNVGGVRTYAKRYLYMEALNISDNNLDLDSNDMANKKNAKPSSKDEKLSVAINEIKLKVDVLRKAGITNNDIANAIKNVYSDGGNPSANYQTCPDVESAKKILDALNNTFKG